MGAIATMASEATVGTAVPNPPSNLRDTSSWRWRSCPGALDVSRASTVGKHVSAGTRPRGTLQCLVETPPVMTPAAATVLARIVRVLRAYQEGQAT